MRLPVRFSRILRGPNRAPIGTVDTVRETPDGWAVVATLNEDSVDTVRAEMASYSIAGFTDSVDLVNGLGVVVHTLIPDLARLRPLLEGRPPQRVQQRRTKGWRKPEGAVSVVRGTDWGNPFKVGETVAVPGHFLHPKTMVWQTLTCTPALAVELYRTWLAQHYGPGIYEQIRRELGGKDLMCYCAPGAPCHADVLLEIANPS